MPIEANKMKLALCMLVKDEVNRIEGCLDPILDLLDQVVIIDTGSRDGTPDLLRRRYGIEPLTGTWDEARCYCLADLRNRSFERVDTPWILTLDADERISPEAVEGFLNMTHDRQVTGYFGRWINHLEGEPDFHDYKLFIFRQGFRTNGLIHENPQIDIRAHGQYALWLGGLDVHHYPEACKQSSKLMFYRERLECGIRLEPKWYRYHWFLGYMEFRAGNFEVAARVLSIAAEANDLRFPVECLNSRMVLAEIQARQRDANALCDNLDAAWNFYQKVAGDFEVAINFRLGPWLQRALYDCQRGRLDDIRAYRFAH
jgi:glycosyltransferase involved in cell wall biosynthesis